jgi:hypothetical protein
VPYLLNHLYLDLYHYSKECKNNLSARVQETVVSELIDKELQKGFIYGPFTQPPFDNYHISPIGVAEGNTLRRRD